MPPKNPLDEFTPRELRTLRSLKTPHGIQRFLDSLPYHLATSAWSPRRVLAEGTAHCLEGAMFGAAALRAIGFPPLVVDLEAERDTDHVIAVYRERGHWGAIAASNYAGCRYREPVYRSLRELALSYFDVYYNLAGDRSLRTFSRPVDLGRFDRLRWMTAPGDFWDIAEYLCEIPHTRLITREMARRLHRLDARSLAAGLVGHATKENPRPRIASSGRRR